MAGSMSSSTVACGQEQAIVLPVAVGLALSLALAITVSASKVAKRRWNSRLEARVLQAQEFLESVEGGADLEDPANGIPKRITDALKDNCVLMFDQADYQSARSQLLWASKALAGACFAALATSGGANLLYSVWRITFIGLLWAHHQLSTAALHSGAAAVAERFSATSQAVGAIGGLGAMGLDPKRRSLVSVLDRFQRSSRRGVWLMRLLLLVAHIGLCIALLVFELIQHPHLIEKACESSDSAAHALIAMPSLIAERSAAITMVAAWVLGALAHACLLKCEACIWVSPRAEQAIGGALQTQRGSLPTGCGLEFGEALCGAAGMSLSDAVLHELLNGFGVAVLSGTAVLRPANLGLARESQCAMPQLTHSDLATLMTQFRTDLRRSLEETEARVSLVVKSNQDALSKKHEASLIKTLARQPAASSGSKSVPPAASRRPGAECLEFEMQGESAQASSHFRPRPRPNGHPAAAECAEFEIPGEATSNFQPAARSGSKSVPPASSRRPAAECLEFEMPGESTQTTSNFQPRQRPSQASVEGFSAYRGRPSVTSAISDDATLESLGRQPSREAGSLDTKDWEKPPQPKEGASSVEKPPPRRALRVPGASRSQPQERRSITPPPAAGAGMGPFGPDEASDASSPSNRSIDNLLEFGQRSSAPGLTRTTTPPPTVRAAPPPSRPAMPSQGRVRSGARPERPIRSARIPPDTSERRPSRFGELDSQQNRPEDGSSGLMEADLHDNPGWSGVNSF